MRKKSGMHPSPDKRNDEQKKNTFACRSCGTQRVDQKDKCPACGALSVPEQKIDVDLLTGDKGWYIIVRTTEHGLSKAEMPFIFIEDGKAGFDPASPPNPANPYPPDFIRKSDNNGVAVIPIGWTESRKHVRFFIVGTRSPSKELDIPRKPEPRPKFWSKEFGTPKDMWEKLFGKK